MKNIITIAYEDGSEKRFKTDKKIVNISVRYEELEDSKAEKPKQKLYTDDELNDISEKILELFD